MCIRYWRSDVCSSDLFDEVPAAIVARRRDPFGGTGNEIRHHRIDRYAGAGAEDAGLAGSAEIRAHPARLQLAFERPRGVHLAPRAVGAAREQAPAAAPRTAERRRGRRCLSTVRFWS